MAEVVLSTVKCPRGHFTHAFLACDVQNACWQSHQGFSESEIWGVPTMTSCPAPLTSLSPMFACSNGVQHVAYTLVCDYVEQCGDGSDEGFCVFPPCPPDTFPCGTTKQNCTCHGLAFACPRSFSASLYPALRYLNAEGSLMNSGQLSENSLLIHVSLKRCGLMSLLNVSLPNLRTADLSENLLTYLSVRQLSGAPSLQVLIVRDNPLTILFPAEADVSKSLASLERMDLSRTAVDEVDFSDLQACPNLLSVNFSNSRVRKVFRSSANSTRKLASLDFRGCPLTELQPGTVSDLVDLQAVFTDDYRMCCPASLPAGFSLKKCEAPRDTISSCDSLIGSTALRVFVDVACVGGVVGNLVLILSFVFRSDSYSGKDAFRIHLHVLDLIMSSCATTVAVADAVFEGHYVLKDSAWRLSWACMLVRALSFLSSQVSVAMVTFLMMNSLLLVRKASRSFSFTRVSAHLTSLVVWVTCVLLTLLVTLQSPSDSPSALCLHLPVPPTPTSVPGYLRHGLVVLKVLFLLCCIAGWIAIVTLSSCHTSPLAVAPALTPSEEGSEWRQVSPLCAVSVLCWCVPCGQALLTWSTAPTPSHSHLDSVSSAEVGILVVAGAGMSSVRPLLYWMGVREEERRKERMKKLLAYCRSKVNARKAN
ncbi:hypothetical protein ACOMHN_060686 [Nucella lapillus]